MQIAAETEFLTVLEQLEPPRHHLRKVLSAAGETLPNLGAGSRRETARGGFGMPAKRQISVCCPSCRVWGVSEGCSRVCLCTRVQKCEKKIQFQLLLGEIRATQHTCPCSIPMVLHPFACSCGKDTQKGIMDKTQLLLTVWGAHSQGFPDCVLGTQVAGEDQLPVLAGQSALNAA